MGKGHSVNSNCAWSCSACSEGTASLISLSIRIRLASLQPSWSLNSTLPHVSAVSSSPRRVNTPRSEIASATLLVRRGKTDPERAGAVVYSARDTTRIVRAWFDGGGIADGFLFRSLSRTGTPGRSLDPSQIPRIFKGMARAADLPDDAVDGLSGHSARVGAAQDMIASGVELAAILQAGRWKTTAMVNRYDERLMARRSGAAQLNRLQRRE